METPDGDKPSSMNIDALERVGRVIAFTKYHAAGDEDEAFQLMAQELAASGGDVMPFARTMVWLLATVADQRPDDLSTWLDDTLGAVMADLMMRQRPPDATS